jgi:hypothetical protein
MNNSHLAAPYRHRLSATADLVLKTGLLSPNQTHLDYGCGRGGDVEKLRELGFDSVGYDPYYFPDAVEAADVVTMSYVLNVIQDPAERKFALLNAWRLAKKYLIVSANVRGAGIHPGEITNLGTFTKYYNHIELKAYIESTLGYEAVKLAKDKFIVYRNGQQFTPLHHHEVLAKVEAILQGSHCAIAQSGWVAPMGVIIKGYCNDFKPRPGFDTVDSGEFPGRIRYYRLLAKTKCLPGKTGLVRCLHIRGGLGSEHMEWAIAALKRRNQIAQAKFHCIEQSFISEFLGCKNFDFTDTNIKIYH